MIHFRCRSAILRVGTEGVVSSPYVESRLVGGATNGRLEVKLSGEWGSVCSAGWRFSNALVVCRQLGHFR